MLSPGSLEYLGLLFSGGYYIEIQAMSIVDRRFRVQGSRFRGSEGRNWNSEVGKSERKVSGVRCQKTEIGMGKREGEGRKKAKVGRWGTEVGKIRGERSKVKGERGLKSEFGRRKW